MPLPVEDQEPGSGFPDRLRPQPRKATPHMLLSLLALGFVIGFQHAFEADHLAAVSSLVSRKRGMGVISRHGAVWGLGHASALLVVSAVVIASGLPLTDAVSEAVEAAVGVLLVVLGGQVVLRLWRDRVHIHVHEHADGTVHLHAHSHRADPAPHRHSDHDHAHPEGPLSKTLLVGLLHGAAGSGALTVYVAATLESPAWGLLYVVVFGIGSVVGMALVSAVISLPLTATAGTLTRVNRLLQACIAVGTVGLGLQRMVAYGIMLAA